MRDSILRVIDDLQTRLDGVECQLDKDDITERVEDILAGRHTILVYTINQLRKVLDDHPNVKDR